MPFRATLARGGCETSCRGGSGADRNGLNLVARAKRNRHVRIGTAPARCDDRRGLAPLVQLRCHIAWPAGGASCPFRARCCVLRLDHGECPFKNLRGHSLLFRRSEEISILLHGRHHDVRTARHSARGHCPVADRGPGGHFLREVLPGPIDRKGKDVWAVPRFE